MMIDYDCKHLAELRESKGLNIDDSLSHRMALSTQHIIALEKNDINFYRSETLFISSLKKYIELLGERPSELIRNLDDLEKKINIKRVKQPNTKKNWLQKFSEDWLI
tara:strand:+ start:8363 stop:8683 length:321 start_codon:yes stop_codon:yes gene_type:complete